MAKPNKEIEIWAQSDVVLPGSNLQNKSRPIDDLWRKGYDKGQKPACEEWNYVWNMATEWLKYITYEQIPELDSRYLQKTLNLSDVPDKVAARNNLGVISREEMDDRFVNISGDTMLGELSLPRVNFSQVADTDFAYIQAQRLDDDKTAFDFVMGDNAGPAGYSGADVMRFRFTSPTGATTSMVEMGSVDSIRSYMKVFGDIQANNLDIASDINWGERAAGKNLSVSEGITTGALSASTAGIGNLSANSAELVSLHVGSNDLTVGGRNAVRAVNGVVADADGNLSINIKTTSHWTDGENNGWWRDDNTGIIEQWGFVNYNKPSSTQEYIPFHINFPKACHNIQLCNFEDFNNENNTWRVKSKSPAGFIFSNGGGNMHTAYMWRAIGE